MTGTTVTTTASASLAKLTWTRRWITANVCVFVTVLAAFIGTVALDVVSLIQQTHDLFLIGSTFLLLGAMVLSVFATVRLVFEYHDLTRC